MFIALVLFAKGTCVTLANSKRGFYWFSPKILTN